MKVLAFSATFLISLGLALASERPIIGIVTEEVYKNTTGGAKSLIAASYVKAVEQSGARVVPLFINRTEEYYINILNGINGVLFPGGGVSFENVGGFGDLGKIILNYTKKVNSAGDHFPVLGVCLGFELLLYLEVDSYSILGHCNSSDVSLPLKFKKKFRQSKLYHKVPGDIIDILSTLPVTYNHHQRCITEDLLKKHNLTDQWRVLSTSIDNDGQEFISSIESYEYPIAGIQFHPEKNSFEWNPSEHIVHSQKAIYSSRYFYDWLVNEARKNNHSFSTASEESEFLIYNYSPTYINNGTGYFVQVYYFD